ncbi:MAG TPA: GrpB family protein [Candidatus Limnocylindria bacterium]|nr:GrpB family protein [Candidatus Limnocylindria bacterium]
MDPELERRLRAAGVDPYDALDPREAFVRLHAVEGQRATLLDRYALEAASRGVPVNVLPEQLRTELQAEVLRLHVPGWEIVGGSDRSTTDPIRIVDYDPAWPTLFQEWCGRLAEALGDGATRIDHVGSTAVPCLAAKPIIDVQISVPDVNDEATYVSAIERAGVAFRARDPEHRYFRPSGDRPRAVQVHVCQAGSGWERTHLLYRDFLRANPETRDAYAALKRDLAARYRDDRIAYTEAKTSFILDTMSRAAAWAAQSGWRVGDAA